MRIASLVCAGPLLVSALANDAAAADGALAVTGKVKIVKARGRDVIDATLTTKDKTLYHLVLDEKGTSLAKVMFNMSVDIHGTAAERDGKKWLTVLRYQTDKHEAGHEYWRRCRCNACVVQNATVHAAAPKDLVGAKPVAGRLYPFKRKIVARARHGRHLWVATDNRVQQIDMDTKSVMRSYDRSNGLPSAAIYDIATTGRALWILYRGGVAALEVGSDSIVRVPGVRTNFARFLVDGDVVWLIGDTATFRLTSSDRPVEKLPALPTGQRMSSTLERGIWVANWKNITRHWINTPLTADGRLYVRSYGDLYELTAGQWKKVASRSSHAVSLGGKIWFLRTKGLSAYDLLTGETVLYEPPEIAGGRFTHITAVRGSIWVAAEPRALPKGKELAPGGLARFDPTTRTWETWHSINELRFDAVAVLKVQDERLWCVTVSGTHETKSAHPGMTYVKKKLFNARSFALHSYDVADGTWESYPLPIKKFGRRFICGQDGGGGDDDIVPKLVNDIVVGPRRIFATTRLLPMRYFSGYWPCIDQIAELASDGGGWQTQFSHRPDAFNLQGEQPLVLNISNKGVMVLTAVGHDEVLGQFLRDDTHWAVTEGFVGYFDEPGNTWQRVLAPGFRFYWKATAALEHDGYMYVGSDRGLVSRMDPNTGLFEQLIRLRNRSIRRIVTDADGNILVGGGQTALGVLPVQLRGDEDVFDWDVARFDGASWSKAGPSALPPPQPVTWEVKPITKKKKSFKMFLRDKSIGNFLWGPARDGDLIPRYYLREVFAPAFLCAGTDGGRFWVSTFTGILEVNPSEGPGR